MSLRERGGERGGGREGRREGAALNTCQVNAVTGEFTCALFLTLKLVSSSSVSSFLFIYNLIYHANVGWTLFLV